MKPREKKVLWITHLSCKFCVRDTAWKSSVERKFNKQNVRKYSIKWKKDKIRYQPCTIKINFSVNIYRMEGKEK
jgi:hypothetical protein